MSHPVIDNFIALAAGLFLFGAGASAGDEFKTETGTLTRHEDGSISVRTSGQRPAASNRYGYDYTPEEARKLGYEIPMDSMHIYSVYDDETIEALAMNGDPEAQRVSIGRLLKKKHYEQALSLGLESAGRLGHTYVLDMLGFEHITRGALTDALTVFAVAAYFGDPQAAEMMQAMRNKLSTEDERKALERAKSLYERFRQKYGG